MATTTGFYVGIGIGSAVVVVVVIFVAMILMYAHRIGDQAAVGIGAMDIVRANTQTVWKIQDINRSVTGIWRGAEAARKILGG